MKTSFDKLRNRAFTKRFILMLSVTLLSVMGMKAEIVHHTVCQPTLSQRGFTRECWENTETHKFYSSPKLDYLDELRDSYLAKTVIYADRPKCPISSGADRIVEHFDLENYHFNWAAVAEPEGYRFRDIVIDFEVKEENVSNARLVWATHYDREGIPGYYVQVWVNGRLHSDPFYKGWSSDIYVYLLPEVKQGDKVRFVLEDNDATYQFHATVAISLEYTFDCHHTFPEGSATCSKCGYTINRKHHEAYQPTTYQQGFAQECWENLDNGKYYADASCTQELTGANLAKVMTYAKLPNSPVSILHNFHVVESDNQQTWGIQLNWAAETTFEHTSTTLHPQNRYVEFKAQEDFAGNARLVWMKDQEDSRQGRFSVDINYNGRNISYSQQHGESLGGVFVLPMPALKKGDIVTFTVVQDAKAEETWVDAGPTFKVCLEYTIDKTIISATKDPDKEDVYYTTFYDGHTAYTLGEGTTAYTGTVSGDNLLLKPIQDNVIAKGEAVIIRSNSNTIALTPTNNEKAKDSANQLRGNDTNISTPANCFIMSYGQDKLGFYKYAVGKPLAAHKAYLVYEKPTGAPALRMVFEDAATGIEDPLQSPLKGDDAIYNLNGIRLNKLQKGINIVNGKKVVIK